MDRPTRNEIERATQQARRLLEDDFAAQLEGTFDVRSDGPPGSDPLASQAGPHLTARQVFQRDRIVAAIEHKRAAGMKPVAAVADYLRDAAFTTLNRFVALKMLEARELVQTCITRGEQSGGYAEYCGMAPGVALLPDGAGYRLYLESLFDELSTEVKVLFDRRDPASVLWPKRATFAALLEVLNTTELAAVWGEDETIGWVYQFFNSGEERKRMREESQAPRNSRELAVRNQFFTPRYVVEFLVDNTLGRTWLEMHGDGSALAERCRYFVRSEGESPRARPRKDPRDLRVLDPACGSGHFLLYAFDLLLVIYEEGRGWQGSDVRSQVTGRTLREDYPDLASLRRALPALILEHNLHGVDIDPRAAQIAALALWLRAQRAWRDLGVPAAERPRVRRTHIVVAEPMPGDATLVEEFAARLDPPLLRDLFRNMVHEMCLAGELGSLLQVEEGIAAELHRAREQFAKQRQTTGFLPGMEPMRPQGRLDLSGIDDDRFFHQAEASILDALRQFAEAAVGTASVRRRLFAGDAAQGIALIDLVRTRFDVVLMNPPFGAASLAAKKEFEKAYPRTKNNIYAAFVERGIGLLHPHGLLGAITSRTGFFLSSFQRWREEILLKEAPPVVFADLGYGVMDAAMVEAAAYCLEKGLEARGMRTTFLRVLEAQDKAVALLEALLEPKRSRGRQRFEVETANFEAVPRSPFAYWVSESLRRLFKELPSFEAEGGASKVGLQTADDFRFVRAWWAVPAGRGNMRWFAFAKGGKFSPFYADIYLCVNWSQSGSELEAFPGSVLRNQNYYFHPGLTWPLRTHRFCPQVLPKGVVISVRGSGIFSKQPEIFLALFSSSLIDLLMHLLSGEDARPQFDIGDIPCLPVPRLGAADLSALRSLSCRAVSLERSLHTRVETSHASTLPALLQAAGVGLEARAAACSEHLLTVETELASIQAAIDERCFALYGIADADRRAITEGFGTRIVEASATDVEDDAGEDTDEDESSADAKVLAAELVSWAVGVAFGRFDVRLATGARPMPTEPEPFDPLPACSPGMLAGDDGLPLAQPPVGYPLTFPGYGILVDDPGHALDLTAAVRAVFDVVFGVAVDRWWSDVAALLDPKGHDLRAWLAGSFFEHHLKRYSKSRRKAPILWQLGTPSGRHSVWLYAHRLTGDTFYQLQNEVVGAKLSHEERRLTGLIQSAGASPPASARKDIAAQEGVVDELRAMLDEVKRVAPLWHPNLDDGVVLTMAPLWRLVPQHKPWQKELRSKWDEIAAGKYDWAHLAMHLWPERVVPKCATDRSLAIAHGLEDVFWAEGADGKWQERSKPTRPLDELVGERSSAAVKAALQSMLEASATTGGSLARKRTR
jgi:hypothetical protein